MLMITMIMIGSWTIPIVIENCKIMNIRIIRVTKIINKNNISTKTLIR